MNLKKKPLALVLTFLFFLSTVMVKAQLPSRVLVGYWHTWNQTGIPFIPLSNVDSRYNVINISFVGATSGDVSTIALSYLHTGGGYSQAQLITDIAAAQAQGKVICLSVGGANNSFRLTSTADKNTFVDRMKTLITTFGVDGIDIDLEQQSYVCMSGTISNPTDPHTTNMIIGLQELLDWYQTTYSKKMILTMAPETVYVTGGLSNWAVNNACGASYLPIIEALRDEIDLMMVQLYNSGSMLGLNGVEYFQGTTNFLVSQTEAIIRGFNAVQGLGTYSGLPASKVVVALPSCSSAGSGSMSTANVKSAIEYLMGNGTNPGTYNLVQAGGYPDLRGMMTWSINNDNTNCNTTPAGNYEYAANFQDIFGSLVTVNPTITFNDVAKLETDPDFNMTATSNSSGAITYSITAGNSFATINSTTGLVSIIGPGTVTVQASQAASGGFNAGTATATLTISSVTSIWNSNGTASSLKAIPSVTDAETVVEIQHHAGKAVLLQLTDMQGKNHYTKEFVIVNETEQIPLNLQSLPASVYVLTLSSASSRETIRIVKK